MATVEISAANINGKLPPELLCNIFSFLTFADLKKALLVCRSNKTAYTWNVIEITRQIRPLQVVEGGGRATGPLGKPQAGLHCPGWGRVSGGEAARNPPAEEAAVPGASDA